MTTIFTRYHNLPTADLLRLLGEARCRSPIIEELCQRLERGDYLESQEALDELNGHQFNCPACEAVLTLCFDPQTDEPSLE